MRGIKRLAQHLDVSIGTVSRALNGKPDVSERTRQRVLEAAKELGYVANQSGRSLRRGLTNAVGFMIELLTDETVSTDSFFMNVFGGVYRSLGRHGLDLIVLPHSKQDDPADFLRRTIARGMVDGVILSATERHDRRIELLSEAGVPFVLLGRSETAGNHPWIDLDFERFIATSVDRLVRLGHRNIALAVPVATVNLRYIMVERFRSAMQVHGLPVPDTNVRLVSSDEHHSQQLADDLLALDPRPTAVILGYEMMAVGLYHRLDELGLVPGRDLSIIGLRESPQSRSLFPRLTCFRIDLDQLGLELGEALVAAMPNGGRSPTAPLRKLWPMALVPGESDGPPGG